MGCLFLKRYLITQKISPGYIFSDVYPLYLVDMKNILFVPFLALCFGRAILPDQKNQASWIPEDFPIYRGSIYRYTSWLADTIGMSPQ